MLAAQEAPAIATPDTYEPPFNAKAEAASLPLPARRHPGKATRFSKDNARTMAARSVAARLAAKANPTPPPLLHPTDPALALIAQELERLSAALAGKLKPSDRVALIGALDRLLERRRILQGEPRPGSARPSKVEPAAPTRPAQLLGVQNGGAAITPGRTDQE